MSSTSNQMKKPIIGITTWRRDLPTSLGEKTDLYTLDPAYARCVQQAGGIPLLLPHGLEDVEVYLDMMDGLVVSGGGDVAPDSYGEEDLGVSYDVNAEADAFEIALLRSAAKRGMPALGICRGAQIMQVAFGGKLIQELHHLYPEHPRSSGTPEKILNQRHEVVLAEDAQLCKIYGSTNRQVNTIHHQCIHIMGEGFRPVGWSSDGIIEAVESTTSWYALGVQWHPEKMKDAGEHALFRVFIAKVQENRNGNIDSRVDNRSY